MAIRQKSGQKRNAIYEGLESFFQEIEKKYNVTREEVLRAAEELGAIKGRIRTYFLVNSYVKKKRDS
ncbi:hypothetical protein [Sediminibacterium ginsengisoli]|uniref:Uncharacterized protein n=1 Tax=Sediminibacterium ginsengisoli TaxID=413434 RepID=A0A1T4KSR6_9BACT|nr:hypothetical protein [Sediminibacterium ginsengisoli]SJZ45423.1 hypothetical protein SAMN04488132_10290 [Sediminibacterium ginsengisoli]